MSNEPLTLRPEWLALLRHAKAMDNVRITDLFKSDLARAHDFTLGLGDVEADFSRNLITEETLSLLCDLARACNLEEWRDQMFSGMAVNRSENRAALHPALRGSCASSLLIDGRPVRDQVDETLAQMEKFDAGFAAGIQGITDIVTLGIGGSTIGPQLAAQALAPFARKGINLHFLSNIDPYSLVTLQGKINPAHTLFIIASKTFTTPETMANAAAFRTWMQEYGPGDRWPAHACAVTGNREAAITFGIKPGHIFHLPEWVGGRFSLWSAIGLPVCLSIGYKNFRKLLDGAAHADKHFQNTPLRQNIPALMGMIGIWHRNFCNYTAQCILPYSDLLAHLPRYIQQLDMESNGKSVNQAGAGVSYKTAPVVFGEVGTNAQHAFLQMLHQGSDIIPCDFIGIRRSPLPYANHQDMLNANLTGQSRALMEGRTDQAAPPHRHFAGNRPSTTIWLNEISPFALGQLLAFYEHKALTQGILWNINSFDQWGVELGKDMALEALQAKRSA